MSLPARIAEKIDSGLEHAGCWLWTASCDRDGYGQVRMGQTVIKAHKAVWESLVGPVPPRMELDHTCRVRRCVNPDHLELVTRQINLLRRDQMAKLTPDQITAVLEDVYIEDLPLSQVAEKHQLDKANVVYLIRNYRLDAVHVPETDVGAPPF